MAVRRPRDVDVVDGHGLRARDGLGGDDAHRLSHVREHHLGGDVADGVHVRHVGAAELVDVDRASFGELDADALQAVTLGPRGEAEGRQEPVRLEHLRLAAGRGGDRHLDAGTGVLDVLDLGAGQDLHAELLVVLGQLLGHVGVLGGDHAVQELHDRHVDAEVGHDVGELDADRARPTDHDGRREVFVEDLLLVADDVLGQLDAHRADGRARGDDQVVEGHLALLAAVGLDVHRGGGGDRAPAVDLGDLVLLHQEVDALDDARADLAGPLVRRTVGHRGVALDAVLRLLMVERVCQLGVLQQGLAGDAAHVEADAAPILLLDHRDALAELRSPDRRHVTTRAGAQDHHIEVSHVLTLSGAGHLGPGEP